MALRIRDKKTVPRGGVHYVQPETRWKTGGYYSYSYVENQIVAHRKGNSLPGATKEQASIDLENYMLNLDPSLGYDPGHITDASVKQGAGCASCGIKVL